MNFFSRFFKKRQNKKFTNVNNIVNVIEEYRSYDIDTPLFSLKGQKGFCRLVDVYDGDTAKVVLDVFGNKFKFIVRLVGIDTCEITSKNEDLKIKAIDARNKILEFAFNKPIANSTTNHKNVQDMLRDDVIIIWIECEELIRLDNLFLWVMQMELLDMGNT